MSAAGAGSTEAVEWYQRAAAPSTAPADRRRRLLAAADAAVAGGLHAVAGRILDEIEPECRAAGDVARVELLRGRIDARSGSTAAASRRFLRAADALEAADPPAAAGLLIESVDASIRAGRPAAALTAAQRARALVPIGAEVALSAAEDAAGELAAALATKRSCGIADATTQPVIGADLVEALVRCGRQEDAAAEAEALRDGAARAGRGSALALAERAQALVAADPAAHFAQAWALHAGAPDRFARARTALAWGDALRRAGQRVESRELLAGARADFELLGAARWEEQAASGLARSGQTLRRGPAGRDELTPAEIEVAGLVAEGKTNRETAGALWMSEKTVEAHLSRIYRKLGVRNRAELAARQLAAARPA